MSVLSDLEKQLTEIDERIHRLVEKAEAHGEVEEALRDAGNGLMEANKEMRQLVKSTGITTQHLSDVLTAFKEAVEILRQSSPTQAIEAIAKVQEQLEKSEHSIQKSIDELTEQFSSSQRDIKKQLKEEVQSIRSMVKKAIIFSTCILLVLLVGIIQFLP